MISRTVEIAEICILSSAFRREFGEKHGKSVGSRSEYKIPKSSNATLCVRSQGSPIDSSAERAIDSMQGSAISSYCDAKMNVRSSNDMTMRSL